ncbi:ATP-binding protein [Brasilonema octagenarum UFV-E1]|uniref:ATP-binding protein n=1 Tax=Brasilonema sennae CENA114 TaxID=415709 RepID=A0A856ME01_9CYAN|nr:ATP-binding protein [Brasilonema sennae]QDL08892.1 ATP-binding protein [Brasilonema sennae CENA114]QDL15249.1 ATP-binding protein [Brasilonema octagenarum UFV-E1]
MATIDEVIKKSLNPFDNQAAGNFWEEQESPPTVESIHQKPLTQIKSLIAQISQDHQTRSLILYGDAGTGKTHFMGQIKEQLNDQAFFVYIEPFSQSDRIWQHILRYTVDSLVNAPVGQADSQLILWIKSCLSTIEKQLKSDQQKFINIIKGFFGKTDAERDRQLFIDILKKTIGTTGIYNANEFFGVLYDLTNPDLYSLACEWLKGDDLDEESLKKLRVKQSIDDEDKARGILGNFSKISAKTQPIVLCFDQLDSIARLPDGSLDLQALFNVNSTIYNGKWKGFLIIISIRTSTWNENSKRVQPSDLDRASIRIPLKRITLEEGEALLASRLYPVHNQASPKPVSPIYPLNQQVLEKVFPSRKATPRNFLMLGRQLFQDYKEWLFRDRQPPQPKWLGGGDPPPPPPPPWEIIKAEFELLWQQEFQKVQEKNTKITLLAASDLIWMLQQALEALQVQEIKPKLISGKYASYSLSYQQPGKRERVGIVWTEDPNMTSFFNVMNACQKAIQQNLCQTMYLLRAGGVGKPNLAGNQIYRQIFTYTNHSHIKPSLSSVHYLATYHSFVKSVEANELLLVGKSITLQELQTLIRESKILEKCTLLQDLGILSKQEPVPEDKNGKKDFRPVKDFLLNIIKSQGYMGVPTLMTQSSSQFSFVKEADVQLLIELLCQEQKVKIINPKAKLQDQLICFIAKT